MDKSSTGTVAARFDSEIAMNCRNRNANLASVLPGWLALDPSEVVVVDWSSERPVADTLAAAGIDDPRVRVIRVEGEDRWCLSYAFNTGFRLARHDRVLKADADIALSADFLARNPLEAGQMVVGNWRTAGAGQKYVNGFFYIHRADLARVNGFNEHITSYGWDDDDLYDRLTARGVQRIDVAPETVRHLDHDDAARLGTAEDDENGWTDLRRLTMFSIRANRFLAQMLPDWDSYRTMLPLGEVAPGRLARAGAHRHLPPLRLRQQAEWLAAFELVFWRAGSRVYALTEAALDRLLTCRRLEAITALHVELALGAADPLDLALPRHLLVDLDTPALAARPEVAGPLADRLRTIAAETGRGLVLRGLRPPPAFDGMIRVPHDQPYGAVTDVRPEDVAAHAAHPVLRLAIGSGDIARLTPRPPAPTVVRPGTGRLFIDAQHGLGNRMRAIGSAGAIAAALGRELVIAWRRDAHCDAPFEALFETDCAIIDTVSLRNARAEGATVLNAMEVGEGAAKGAPLVLEDGRDAYVRSAYVITHEASHWAAENAALRRILCPLPEIAAAAHGPSDVALHIRMEAAGGAFDAAENWSPEGHAAIRHWRSESHYGRFMARLDALLAETSDATVFLAADQAATREAFAARYGARVSMGPEPAIDPGADRSTAALQAALAEMLGLARARHLLASPWSSFSEVALRLSERVRAYEQAGRDF